MAGSTLTVDGGSLERLWSDLIAAKSEFDSADRNAADAADACGHVGLADRVRSFSASWDHTRSKLADAIGDLATAAKAINDGFSDVENELVSVLDPGATP
ncbi:hypothetical protein ACPEEZ_02460 [Frigoribacterium sp. 2-23]|uniref:hypothetical protein n=1 Tax=Frigoribacterium sp. 2-23 TaxID=3415006 RepID=UPI003C6EB384